MLPTLILGRCRWRLALTTVEDDLTSPNGESLSKKIMPRSLNYGLISITIHSRGYRQADSKSCSDVASSEQELLTSHKREALQFLDPFSQYWRLYWHCI